MQVQSVRIAALLAASLIFVTPQAYGGECLPTGLASYSNLGRAMAKMRNGASGELLAIWLLQSPDPTECKFVFRVDRLLSTGSIISMSFDAQTLDEVANDEARGWSEYGGSGQGGEASGSGEGGGASGGDDDDDKSVENSEDNSGSGSSSSGSGSSGSDDSSGSGSGSDDSGSGGSGSDDGGSGGSSGSGSDDSGSGSSGSGSDGSGSGSSGSGSGGSGSGDD